MNFFDTLREIRQGQILSEAQDALREVVSAVRASGRPGKVTLTLTVAPVSKDAEDHQLIVTDDIKTTMPRQPRGSTVFFATDGDELTRRDPRQPELPGMKVVQHVPAAATGTNGNTQQEPAKS